MQTARSTDRLHHGKQWLDYGGLGIYANGARLHDALTASYGVPDPLADKYPDISPYAHCAGDPINLIDLDGREPQDRITDKQNQEAKYDKQAGSDPEIHDTNEMVNKDAAANVLMQASTAVTEPITYSFEYGAKTASGTSDYAKVVNAFGKEGAALYTVSKGAGFLIGGLGVAGTAYNGIEYATNGGDNLLVYGKLAFEFGLGIAAIFGGPVTTGVAIIYTIADFATSGYGTNKIIEETNNKNR